MSNLLAEHGGLIHLAVFADHLQGCNLSTPIRPSVNANRYHLWQGRIWVWSKADPSQFRFFPTIMYRGCKVKPYGWASETVEPCLIVLMEGSDLNLSTYFVKPPANDPLSIMAAMRADGWAWDLRDNIGSRAIRVDDLEKIEGPPPEGAF